MFNANTVNAHKRNNTRNYRVDYNKGKRQFGDSDSTKTNQPKAPDNYNQTTGEYTDAVPTAEPNVRTNEYDQNVPTMMPAPQHMYSDGIDPGSSYGVPFVYGMYPQINDSERLLRSGRTINRFYQSEMFADFASYPVPVQGGGMMYTQEPLNVDSDLTQTYPYFNAPAFYYPTQMQQLQIGQPQVKRNKIGMRETLSLMVQSSKPVELPIFLRPNLCQVKMSTDIHRNFLP